jgi:peptidoglycan/LPS O-acetylase OafA/YrhL
MGKFGCHHVINLWPYANPMRSWYCALFLSGAFLCELEKSAGRDKQTRPTLPASSAWHKILSFWLFWLAVYLGNVPHVVSQQLFRMPGWYFLSLLKPPAMSDPKWFYLFWAASTLILAIMRLPRLQRVLESNTLQYLGRISFGLYLAHGPVLRTLGDVLYSKFGPQQSVYSWANQGVLGLELGFLLPQVILLPVTLYLADSVTKYIDEPTQSLLHSMYRKATVP